MVDLSAFYLEEYIYCRTVVLYTGELLNFVPNPQLPKYCAIAFGEFMT